MKVPLAEPVSDEEMRNAALDALQSERLVLGDGSLLLVYLPFVKDSVRCLEDCARDRV